MMRPFNGPYLLNGKTGDQLTGPEQASVCPLEMLLQTGDRMKAFEATHTRTAMT